MLSAASGGLLQAYYKLKFVSAGIGQDGGQRGYPEIEYKLLK